MKGTAWKGIKENSVPLLSTPQSACTGIAENILTVMHNDFLQAFTSYYIELNLSIFIVRNFIVHIRHG